MGFLDKAKEKASELAEKAKEKVDDVQAKRKADDLLEDLGRIVFADKTGRAAPTAADDTARIVGELTKMETEGTVIVKGSEPGGSPLPPPAP